MVFGGGIVASKSPDLVQQGSDLNSEPLAAKRGRSVEGLPHPLIDALDNLDEALLRELRQIAARTGGSGKVPHEDMCSVVCLLCRHRYLTIKVLARLLSRKEDYLRQRVLNPMVSEGLLARAFPTTPNHPSQAYTSKAADESSLKAMEAAQ
jgi:hypothetical protein